MRTAFHHCLITLFLMTLSHHEARADAAFDSNWTSRNPLPSGEDLHAIIVHGGTFIRVGEQGTIATSSDAISWAEQVSGTSNTLRALASDGTKVIVAGEHGTLLTSLNGITWTQQSSPSSINWLGIAWNGSVFVAVGENGRILSSADSGVTWSRQISPTTKRLTAVTALGGMFVAVGAQGIVLTSNDGVSWTAPSTGLTSQLNSVTASGALLVAVGDGGSLFSSSDGTTWTAGTSGVTHTLFAAKWTGTEFIVVGDRGTLLTSPDGSAWTAQSSGTASMLNAVASSGALHLVGGERGAVLSSTDTLAWTPRQTGSTATMRSIAKLGAQLIAVGDAGSILTSADGNAWTAQASGTSQTLLSIASDDTRTVACGVNGTLLVSNNGTAWTEHNSHTTECLNSVASNGSFWLALGNNGSVCTSTGVNPTSWSKTSLGSSHLTGVTWTGSLFVAVASDGKIFTSSNGTSWTPRSSGVTNGLSSVVWTGFQVVAVGEAGTVLTSATGTTWSNTSLAASTYGSLCFSTVNTIGSSLLGCGYSSDGPATHGAILTSGTGSTWSIHPLPTNDLRSVVTYVDRAVTVGNAGGIFTSGTFVIPDAGFALGSSTASESAGSIDVIVTLSAPPSASVSIPFSVLPSPSSTATPGATLDYTIAPSPQLSSSSSVLIIPAGQTSGIIRVTINDDHEDENAETLVIRLDAPAPGATLVGTLEHTLTITDNDTAPSVTAHDIEHRIVALGSNTLYTVTATGDAPLSYRWLKNGVTIKNQSTNSLSIANTPATAYGAYSVVVSNLSGSITLGPANLTVVNAAAKTYGVVFDHTVTLSISASAIAPVPTYRWRKGIAATVLTDDGRITGATTKSLVIRHLVTSDSDIYTCEVSHDGLHFVGGNNTLDVIIPPVIQTSSLPTAVVSETYNTPIVALNSPTSYTTKGLPLGLTCNSKTGLISGKARVSGHFEVYLRAHNAAGYSAVIPSIPLDITDLPVGTVGAFGATISRLDDLDLGENMGGLITITTTKAGTYTGSIKLGAKRYSVKGALDTSALTNPQVTNQSIPRSRTTPLALSLVITPGATPSLAGGITDDTLASVSFVGRNATPLPVTAPIGLHTFALPLLNNADVGVRAIPQGYTSGYFKVSSKGTASGSVYLADGSVFTFASPLRGDNELAIYAPLYSYKGSVLGSLQVGAAPAGLVSTTGMTWLKKTQVGKATATLVRTYGTTFGVIDLSAFGGYYDAPVAKNGDIVMGLIPSLDNVPNAHLLFEYGDVPTPSTRLPYEFRLIPTASRDPQTPSSNPGFIALSITSSTGAFKGSFKLSDDDNTLAKPKPLTRTSAFKGYIVRDAANVRKGYGYFILANMPQNAIAPITTSSTSPLLSGTVLLEAQ